MSNQNTFYVYQLRLIDEVSPFYVGKGKGDRIEDHFIKSSLKERSHKNHKINKAIREGRQIVREFLKYGLSEDDAFMWEVFYIAEYGRSDLGLGPLTNLTDGGEGSSGCLVSIETRQKLSLIHKGKIVSPTTRELMKEGRTGVKVSIETKKKMRKKNCFSQWEKRRDIWSKADLVFNLINEGCSNRDISSILNIEFGSSSIFHRIRNKNWNPHLDEDWLEWKRHR